MRPIPPELRRVPEVKMVRWFIIVGLFGFLILGGLCLYDGIRFLAMTPERFDVEYNSAFLL